MSAKIYVTVDDAWDFFEDHRARLKKEFVEIASCDDTVVYMTEYDDMPQLTVEIAGKKVETINVFSSFQLAVLLEEVYADYILFPDGEGDTGGSPANSADDVMEIDPVDDAIMRDDELICATDDFLQVVLSEKEYEDLFTGYGYDMQRGVLIDICDMLEEKYGVNIYFPVIITDESGNEAVVERGEPKNDG